ncbi:putative peptidase tripeptidyl-peptidase [Diaporthe ampelina]|uniref:Putative peptidase tripeptidyl-peptidase n=1 Tax=Diaporthe ampelina TaxID=1214573 RepID=A0A0G2G0N1_9PEZI|nr:putative peptidase tripeptidyl-peptidase [Diaporthe ampelina]
MVASPRPTTPSDHWAWGNNTAGASEDPYAGRGIFLCGYIDVPLDYKNESDPRITRLAVTKFQVSGLARTDGSSPPGAGTKSERTLVLEPGGPGGSGTRLVWSSGELLTERFTVSQFDALGWDPRGVNASQPAISCFPYDADRDRWSALAGQYREQHSDPETQLRIADAMNNATFHACWKRHGDLGRFMTTTLVARDLEEIRKALGEDELTGYLVSYGTGIGQTYANMFPDSVGRIILDGTEYIRDHRLLGGFGWTALDNATDAFHDGFLGECLNAGPEHCALARPRGGRTVVLKDLEQRMKALVTSLISDPIPGYTEYSGPSLVTYSALVGAIYGSLYNAKSWPALAEMLYELEAGNSTLAAAFLELSAWEYDPTLPQLPSPRPSTDELGYLVICGDSYDAPAQGLAWWSSLWSNMTSKSFISGNSRFSSVFPCRHFTTYWPEVAEAYRGALNNTLKNPILLIAETYDPATPLRNGRRLAAEMGKNARLIAHHGYGHSSRDLSNCTEDLAKAFILNGTVPEEPETACFANEKPYLIQLLLGKNTF